MKYFPSIFLLLFNVSCIQAPEEKMDCNITGFWESGSKILVVRDSIMIHPYYDIPGFFKYELIGDSLIVFDKCISELENNFTCSILKVGNEELKVIYEKDTVNYNKIKNIKAEGFKKLTFEAGECFGTCPTFSMEINSDGKLIFNGIDNTTIIGVKKFTLDSITIQEISSLLNLVDIKNYPDEKFSPLPDDPIISMMIEYENAEVIKINGGLFEGKYYNLIKYFYQFETLIEKDCSTAPKKTWGGQWSLQGLFFVTTFVTGGQESTPQSPTFLGCRTLYAILHIAKQFTLQANGRAQKFTELIKISRIQIIDIQKFRKR